MDVKKIRTTAVVLLFLLAGAGLIVAQGMGQQMDQAYQFSIPRKAAHWESNVPEHGAVLSAPPSEIRINADMDMGPGGKIALMKDGKNYAMGDVMLSPDMKTLTIKVDPNAPTGMYTVDYTLCWPDRTCHDGMYEFAIKS